MDSDPEIEELRQKLVGVKWEDFVNVSNVHRNGVIFRGRFGSYLGKFVCVVIAHGKFVVVTPVTEYNRNRYGPATTSALNPAIPTSGQEIFLAAVALRDEGKIYVIPCDERGNSNEHAA